VPYLIGLVAGVALATAVPWSLGPAAPDRTPPPYVVRVQPPPDLAPLLKRLDGLQRRADDAAERLYWLQRQHQ